MQQQACMRQIPMSPTRKTIHAWRLGLCSYSIAMHGASIHRNRMEVYMTKGDTGSQKSNGGMVSAMKILVILI